MSTTYNGGPAFPSHLGAVHGMSLRDYFASKALPVHMAELSNWDVGSQEAWHSEVSRLSFATADAMLQAREAK